MLQDLFCVLVGSRNHNHVEAGIFRTFNQRQPMRTDKPILGDKKKYFEAVSLHIQQDSLLANSMRPCTFP